MGVYATSYNVRTALSFTNLDEHAINIAVVQDIILMKDLHLPSSDYISLKALYLFLENPEEFLKKYFRGWKDTLRFLIEEPPAYHKNNNCSWFKKDFFNVKISKKIKDKKLIKEARLWSNSNKNLLKRETINEFIIGFIKHFNDKHNVGLETSDLEEYARPNSGEQILNAELNNITEEIEKLLNSANQTYNSKQLKSYKKEYKEKKYCYSGEYRKKGAYLENKIFNDLNFLRFNIIKPLNENVKDYIFLKLNNKNEYQENILKYLHFRECRARECKA